MRDPTNHHEPLAIDYGAVCSGGMLRWAKLNDRQLAALRRISADVEPVSAQDHALANTVYALRGSGLVTTPRRDGIWHAEITEAGAVYLEHGYHPDDPSKLPSPTGGSAESYDQGTQGKTAKPPPKPAAELIAQLQTEGGTLWIDDPDDEVRASYRRAVDAAKRHGLVPQGHHLRHTGRDRGDMVIRLTDDADPDETDWNRVRLRRSRQTDDPNVIADAVQTNPGAFEVSQDLLPRVITILKLLAQHASRRGQRLSMSRRRKTPTPYLKVRSYTFEFTIKEDLEKVPRTISEAERQRRELYSWQRIRTADGFEDVPTGRLRLVLTQPHPDEQASWADDKRSLLDRKLDKVILEAERRADAADQRRREQEVSETRFSPRPIFSEARSNRPPQWGWTS